MAGISFTKMYMGIKKIPYCLGSFILTSVFFIKEHLIQFSDIIFKFLSEKLTAEKCMLAFKYACQKIHDYKTRLSKLNDKELLNHIVHNIVTIPEIEEEDVKTVLCGEFMKQLLNKLQAKKNRNLIQFCIEYVREKAINISSKYNEILSYLRLDGISYDIIEFDKKFCKVFELEKCCMSEYFLCGIKESINETESILTSYHLHISKPENALNEILIASYRRGFEKLNTYEIPAPGNSLDSNSCIQFAQTFDSQNHEYNEYTYIQPESNVWVLFSMLGFSVRLVLFRIDTFDGELSLNISFYNNIHKSINRRLQS